MTEQQWDSLCDGCGRCCLIKAWHVDQVKSCRVACKLLDVKTAKCRDYDNRQQRVSNCVKITIDVIDTPGLLPNTCAYKLLKDSKPLYDWHPLVSGTRQSVQDAGISVIGWVEVNEDKISLLQLSQYLQQTLD